MDKYTQRPCYRHVLTCGFTGSQAGGRAGPVVGTHGVWDWGSWDALPRCRHHLSASRAGVSFAGVEGGNTWLASSQILPARGRAPPGVPPPARPRCPGPRVTPSVAAGSLQTLWKSLRRLPTCVLRRDARTAASGSLRAWPRGALLAGHEDELSRPTPAALSLAWRLEGPVPAHCGPTSASLPPPKPGQPPSPRADASAPHEAGRAWLPDQGRLGAAAALWVPRAQGRWPREAQADADACEQARDTAASGSGQLGQKLRALSRHEVPGNGSWQKSMSSKIAHPIIPA